MSRKFLSSARFFATIIFLVAYLQKCACADDDDEFTETKIIEFECENDCDKYEEGVEEVSHSRQKRALVFPSGSSLQLAYDQTCPIVAAQLLFTVGVTIALAFELPDKPIHHITQELREHLQIRIHGGPKKTTAAPDTNSTDSHSRIDMNNKDLKYVYNSKDAYYNLMNKHNYYYGSNGFKDRIDNESTTIKPNTTAEGEIISRKVVKTSINKDGKKVVTMKIKYGGKKKLGNIFMRKHNRVYPVFGKRSVDDHLTHEDLSYMDHHRNSRFEVYEKVERFLNGRGIDGTGCVLRALCETAQKNQNEEKAPFLIEILRAIFTLPHQVLPYKKDSHQVYDDAHSNLNAECAQLYPQCKDSIWSPDFRF